MFGLGGFPVLTGRIPGGGCDGRDGVGVSEFLNLRLFVRFSNEGISIEDVVGGGGGWEEADGIWHSLLLLPELNILLKIEYGGGGGWGGGGG